jgi:uncharacterized protein (TIGR00369 family)
MVSDEARAFVDLAFAAQRPLAGIGVTLDKVEDGAVTLSFPVQDNLCTAGTGIVLGGITALVADVAAGLSLITRLDPPRPVVTVEMAAHQIAPGKGERIVCIGSVLKAGRSMGIARADVYAEAGGSRRLASTLTATFSIP